MCTLFRSEILGLFGDTLTADDMYSPHRWEKLQEQVPRLLYQKRRTFSQIFIPFSKSIQNFAHFEMKRSAA